MNPMPELAPMLKRLRLSGILETLPARNQEAIDNKLAYSEFLALLVQDEVARREHKKFNLRLRRAGFRGEKTLEGFDFKVVSKRYDKGKPIILTSNKSYAAWGDFFPDPVLATALLDRLLHHATTISIRGDSYRLRHRRNAGLSTHTQQHT